MINSLTCFKCHKSTATLTYEENRIYKVSCPCGCEYSFEHSSMKCAEEYHCKMLELYAEINRADRLKSENAKLRELVELSAEDQNIGNLCEKCCAKCVDAGHDMGEPTFQCGLFNWQHADKLKELGILQGEN